MSQVVSRKRPAPGTSPVKEQPQPLLTSPSISVQMTSTQNLQRNAANQPPAFPNTFSSHPSNYPHTPQNTTLAQPTFNQVTRRPPAQDLAQAQRSPYVNGSYDVWPSSVENETQQVGEAAWQNNGDELDHKALTAKRDAQAKRKQIPPFVQKLSR